MEGIELELPERLTHHRKKTTQVLSLDKYLSILMPLPPPHTFDKWLYMNIMIRTECYSLIGLIHAKGFLSFLNYSCS